MFIATLSIDTSAPAERYAGAAHSTPLERENVGIPFSINIALRWSAALSPVSRIWRNP